MSYYFTVLECQCLFLCIKKKSFICFLNSVWHRPKFRIVSFEIAGLYIFFYFNVIYAKIKEFIEIGESVTLDQCYFFLYQTVNFCTLVPSMDDMYFRCITCWLNGGKLTLAPNDAYFWFDRLCQTFTNIPCHIYLWRTSVSYSCSNV